MRSGLQNVGKCWSEFYRNVKRWKGNRENIPAIKRCNGGLITDPVENATNPNNYYVSVFSRKRNIPKIKSPHFDEPFITKISIIRKRLAATGKNKSVGPEGIPGEILKVGGEAIVPYLARLLDITINNGTIPTGELLGVKAGGA